MHKLLMLQKSSRFPSFGQRRQAEIMQAFYEKTGIPSVLGCVDGSLAQIKAPEHSGSM